jgi:4-amino-4-deoxy-L-arabinose transferase-like glycosyltransferase
VAILFSLLLFPRIAGDLHANVDPDRLGELSGSIVAGKGYAYLTGESWETAFDRGPIYPGIVAGIRAVTGSASAVPVQIFQALLHGLTCWFVFLLASLLYSRRISLGAQALCAIHPMLLWYTARLWLETTHTFLVTLSAYYLLLLLHDPSFLRGTMAGILLGIVSLTKSVLLPFAVLVGTVFAVAGGIRFRGPGCALATATILVVLPWTMRNYAGSGMVVPVHTSLGFNLMQGDAIADHWREIPSSSVLLWESGNARADSLLTGSGFSPSDPAGDRVLVRAALRRYLAEPLFWAERVGVNAATFFYLSESPMKSLLLSLMQLPLYALALWGLRRGANPRTLMLAAIILYFVLAHACIVGWARYSVPVVPLVVVLAAGVVWRPRHASASTHGAPSLTQLQGDHS